MVSLCPLAGQEAYEEDYDYEDDDFFDFGNAPEIMVTGTQDTTQQRTVIARETIEKSAARDLAALLEEEINMSVIRYGGIRQSDRNEPARL